MRACWSIGLLFVWVGSVCAQSSVRLYEIQMTIPVPQNPKETHAALREALLSEVVRLSGQPKTRENKTILSKADNAEAYIDRYSYSETENPSADPQKVPTTQLHVTFAPRLIDKLLSDAKFSAWTTYRPLLLVLAKESDGGFASTSAANNISKQLQQALDQRGVVYVLPKMDADDLLVLGAMFSTPSDDQWALLQARYGYQAVLMGELTQHDQEGVLTWSGKWQLIMGGRTTPFDQVGNDPPTVITQAVDQVANVLTTTAAKANKTLMFTVSVTGIDGDNTYKRIRAYLEQLTSAEMVKFVKTDGDTVVYQVISKPNLEKKIADDSVLSPDAQRQNTDTQLFYAVNNVF